MLALPSLKRACVLLASITLSAAAVAQASGPHNDALQQLREGFLNPPDSARPMVRWWWFGPAVTRPEILRELQQMKADGIGGAELAFVYAEELDDPARGIKNLAFLSPEHLEAVTYAKDQGRKLGLRIDVTLCSGWPYGGPATTLEEAAGRLRVVEVAVPATATSLTLPTPVAGDTLLSASLVHGEPRHWDAATAQPLNLESLDLHPATQPRIALFFYASHTKQQVKRAAVGAEGYVLDPFSHQAVATHLKSVGEPLVQAFGATPPYAIFSDSLEAYGADWTPTLPAEFKKRRGYDLLPHLPELVAGGTPAAENIRHDWGKTLTELVNENYLTQIDDWAKTHGTKFRSQTYGEPAVTFSSQRLAALPEGEGPQWRAFSTLRWASSANHVFGNSVTSGETFTWLHSPVFRATPLDMKAEADIDFIMGENQLVFHGWPYSPPGTDIKPGWSLYAAANFNDNNPWHPVMPAVDTYIQRISWLLRQGQPANQVAVLLPTDDAWAGFTPGKVTVTGAMQKLLPKAMLAAILSAGYNYDYIDAEAIHSVGLGTHQVLVIPPTDRIPANTLAKINEWAAKGGKVIAVSKLPSMDADGKPLNSSMKSILLVPAPTELPQALHDAAKPDLAIKNDDPQVRNTLGFIHRKTKDDDIYFLVNTGNTPLKTIVDFKTDKEFAERWDVESTGLTGANFKDQDIELAPYESALFVFSNRPSPPKLAILAKDRKDVDDLSTDWKLNFVGTSKSMDEHTLTDWTANATTLHYSGEVIYSRNVTHPKTAGPIYLQIDGGTALPGAPNSAPEHVTLGPDGLPNPLVTGTGPGMHAYFEPPIREAALVTINGQPAGALWHPPYRLDVTKLLKPGENRIEIHVFNTALNAWSSLPPHDFTPLTTKYGDRFQMQDLNRVQPISSGIVGTIKLVTESAQ